MESDDESKSHMHESGRFYNDDEGSHSIERTELLREHVETMAVDLTELKQMVGTLKSRTGTPGTSQGTVSNRANNDPNRATTFENEVSSKESVRASILKSSSSKKVNENQNTHGWSIANSAKSDTGSTKTDKSLIFDPNHTKTNETGSHIHSVDFRSPSRNHSGQSKINAVEKSHNDFETDILSKSSSSKRSRARLASLQKHSSQEGSSKANTIRDGSTSSKASSHSKAGSNVRETSSKSSSHSKASSFKKSNNDFESEAVGKHKKGCRDGDLECYTAYIDCLESRIKELEEACGNKLPKSLAVLEHTGQCKDQARYTLEADLEDPDKPRRKLEQKTLELSFCSANITDAKRDEGSLENAVDSEDEEDLEEYQYLIEEYSRFLPCARNAVKEQERRVNEEKESDQASEKGCCQGYECERQHDVHEEIPTTKKDKFNKNVDTILAAMIYDKEATLKIMGIR